ncbi:MAG: aminotransferase class V-fold PLP-dependent enzyme [Myxococcota bacterium]|nr:aminotransferase class V-fold PLP-dependent enzyme [Myxococcota bacterium]
MVSQVYLDHNASALPALEANLAMRRWIEAGAGNPSSVHRAGRAARAALEGARRAVAASLSTEPRQLTFTSGATEALHLAIASLTRPGDRLLCSAVEHPALYGAATRAQVEVERVPVDRAGRLSVNAFLDRLEPSVTLVALIGAQNELGNCYPVAELAAAIAPRPLLCDAVQLWGKRPLSPTSLGATALTLSGHKIGAPAGIGALWLAPGVTTCPILSGGAQERGRRAGTENLLGAIGMGAAAETIPARLTAQPRIATLAEQLRDQLHSIAGVELLGEPDPAQRLSNTVAFRLCGVEGDLLLQALDLAGFQLSSGAACSSGSLEPSSTLLALGLDSTAAREGLRLSMGPESTSEELDAFLHCFRGLAERFRQL